MKSKEYAKTPISDQDLMNEIKALPPELTPERDLWSGIEKAIQQQPKFVANSEEKHTKKAHKVQHSKSTTFAWAASVVAAVVLTWGLILPSQKIDEVVVIEQDYQQQKQTLLVSYGQPDLKKLSPEMQEQFAQLSSAQLTIKKALKDDPNNTDLLNLLRWTQQQELDLLKQLYSPQWQTI